MFLKNFHSIRPPHETDQESAIRWFIDAHVKASGEELRQSIEERLWHVGCKPGRIAKRGHVSSDYLHRDWDRMELFGKDLGARMNIFREHAIKVFDEFYETAPSPEHLIHVTCTGYISPSAGQELVSKRGWKTAVTHAYHMGCYGAIPALRMCKGPTDIIHTEICSIHANPHRHETDQLVCQSLFGDGFIKYSVDPNEGEYKLLQIREEIIPDSRTAMTWNVGATAHEMTLAKEVPVLIARALPSFIEQFPKDAYFAIHPGGPKILDQLQKILGLSDKQLETSYDVLRKWGNMSSATLPHIWMEMLPKIPRGAKVISLAFGPGLTIASCLLEKR